MKVYLILQENAVIRLYKRKTDFLKFLKLYSDDETGYLIIDTKCNTYPNIEQEKVQIWGVSFERDSLEINKVVRGISFKPGTRFDDIPWKGTTTIFVSALTKQEAIDKAWKIYNDNGED
jgi:hypothetical protein